MTEEQVTVDLPTAIAHRGIAYGPGKAISVPRAVAEAHGLTGKPKVKPAEPDKGAKK